MLKLTKFKWYILRLTLERWRDIHKLTLTLFLCLLFFFHLEFPPPLLLSHSPPPPPPRVARTVALRYARVCANLINPIRPLLFLSSIKKTCSLFSTMIKRSGLMLEHGRNCFNHCREYTLTILFYPCYPYLSIPFQGESSSLYLLSNLLLWLCAGVVKRFLLGPHIHARGQWILCAT